MQTAANAFESVLAYATKLGLQIPDTPEHQTRLDVVEELLETHKRINRLNKDLLDSKEALFSLSLCNKSKVQQRNEMLGKAIDTLTAIIEHKNLIVKKLKEGSTKSNIIIPRQHQPDFVELLACCAKDTAQLQQGLQELQWADQFREAPDIWEESLKLLPTATEAVTELQQQLRLLGNEMLAFGQPAHA